MSRSFPAGFLWGAAAAGHQIEGNNSNSDTWFAEHVTPTVFKEPSGLACDSYNRWEEDLDLIRAMNLNTYRFSVEWARIEPTEGTFSEAELDHYEAIIDGAKARGFKTVVTLNHFTSPHWFAAKAGWLNPAAPELFARFTRKVIERFGDRIDYVITFNEPDLMAMLKHHNLPAFVQQLSDATVEACSKAAGVERYRLANVMRLDDIEDYAVGMERGHIAARQVIRELRPNLPLGISVAVTDDQVVPGADPALRDAKRAEVYERWLRLAADDDFCAVQNYEREVYDGAGKVEIPADANRNFLSAEIYPPSLAGAVRYVHEFTGKPILITEHGLSTNDDSDRAKFIPAALSHLLDAIEDGVPVIGYIHWSFLDNFEWIFGYEPKFGLVSVDRSTMERTRKPSSFVYQEIATNNAL